jgi:hypothetical protein
LQEVGCTPYRIDHGQNFKSNGWKSHSGFLGSEVLTAVADVSEANIWSIFKVEKYTKFKAGCSRRQIGRRK